MPEEKKQKKERAKPIEGRFFPPYTAAKEDLDEVRKHYLTAVLNADGTPKTYDDGPKKGMAIVYMPIDARIRWFQSYFPNASIMREAIPMGTQGVMTSRATIRIPEYDKDGNFCREAVFSLDAARTKKDEDEQGADGKKKKETEAMARSKTNNSALASLLQEMGFFLPEEDMGVSIDEGASLAEKNAKARAKTSATSAAEYMK